MRFAFHTLGCKVNQYETQAMEELLLARGHKRVPFQEAADAYIINSCTVTAVSDKKSRQAVRQARKRAPEAIVALCGCFSQVAPQQAEALPVDLIGGSGDRLGFLQALEEVVAQRAKQKRLDDAMHRRSFEALPAGGLEGRTRAMLKVEDGCTNFCTYCIIPYARGPVRSLPLEQAAQEAKGLAAAGYRELVLLWPGPPRPAGDGGAHRDGVPGGPWPAGAPGLPGAPDGDGGLLHPPGGPAGAVPPLPPVPAKRLRRDVAADGTAL